MKNKRQVLLIALAAAVLAVIVILVALFNGFSGNGKVRVGYIMTGSTDEQGWNGMNYKGIAAVCENMDAELIVKENVTEGTGMCAKAIEELADSDAQLIILSSYGYPAEVREIIDSYPETSFYGISADYYSDNMTSYFGRMYQARYLSGIIAGMMTESGSVGYVAAMPNNEVNRGINAFAMGVRRVNPDAYVNVIFTDSWDDSEKEKAAAEKLIADGADVLAYHQNRAYTAETAESKGVYSIGYNEADDRFSDKYLTAAVWNWELLYNDIVKDFMQGRANSRQHHWCGIETGAVGLSEYSPLVSQEIINEVEKAKAEILSGKDVFSGEIYDNSGNRRCGKDEFISDSALMSEFDWYVDGVIINE